MLDFLQTGKALYVLAAMCVLGVLSRWLTRNLYKRLIKESENMALTKNKNLRLLKQKTESTYQVNQGIPRVKPYLEKQMYEFKWAGISFQGWNIFANQMTLWCFLAGGVASFASYWYRTDPYYIVLYGSMGILTGLFTILVDQGAGISEKRQQLFASLDNYLENTLIYHMNQDREEREAIPGPVQSETRENIRSLRQQLSAERTGSDRNGREQSPAEAGMQKTRAERMKSQLKAELKGRAEQPEAVDAQRSGKGSAEVISIPNASSKEVQQPRSDVDYLKRSLEQIAASRERDRRGKKEEDWLKDLNSDELKLIGEILQGYLT